MKYRDMAKGFHRVKVGNGASTSFWLDEWSGLGRIHNLTGPRGVIDLGIAGNATVELVINTHRRRQHLVEYLNRIEEEIDKIIAGKTEQDSVSLWRSLDGKFKKSFTLKGTWQQIRVIHPKTNWSKGICLSMLLLNSPSLLGLWF